MTRQFYYFYSSILPSILTFLVNYYFSHKLSLSDYGSYGVFFPVFNLILPFILCGQASVIMMQYFAHGRTDQKELGFEIIQALYIMMACFVVFGLGLVLSHYFVPIGNLSEIPLSFLLLISVAALSEGVKQFFYTLSNCFDDYKIFFWVTNVQALVFVGIVFFAPSILNLFLSILVANVLATAFLFLLLKRKNQIQIHWGWRKDLVKTMFILGLPSIGSMFLSSAFLYSDRFIIHFFRGEIFPYYVLASTLAVGIGSVGISAVLKGESIRAMNFLQLKNFIDLKKILKYVELFLVGLCGLTLFFNYVFGHTLFIRLFTEKFESSFQYVAPLCFSVFILGAAQFYSLILIQMKKFNVVVYLQLASLGINVCLSYLMSRFFKVEFILVSFLVTNSLYFLMIYAGTRKYLGVKDLYFPKYLFAVALPLFAIVFSGAFLK